MDDFSEGIEALLKSKGQRAVYALNNSHILCIGAGGLGCEILKSLALTGFKNIDVIDMDTIDISNLNRQFLFREGDISKSKAKVAAEFINSRVPTCNITAYCNMIQDMSTDFYAKYDAIIGGLDSVKARKWISAKLVEINKKYKKCIPYVDGGSESWKGAVKVIWPGETACMQCQASVFTKPTSFQMCTIASKPRSPEHCIAYAKEKCWPLERPGEKINGDNEEHINWLMERAVEQGKKFGISGITRGMTRSVIKKIVPAIASTQAVVASILATEVLKILTGWAPAIDNNLIINSSVGVYSHIYSYEKDPNCTVCGRKVTEVPRIEGETVEEFRVRLGERYNCPNANLSVPKEGGGQIQIYLSINSKTKANLKEPISKFAPNDKNIIVATSRENQLEIAIKDV